ncbi:RNA polymerase sigma factor [Acidicapsa acidisoli]|uniref:RNA polymerase sigma factor n=1 Tax=Acidicapsa acidisoli TaxID=1615681 RepID=UPI0037C12817
MMNSCNRLDAKTGQLCQDARLERYQVPDMNRADTVASIRDNSDERREEEDGQLVSVARRGSSESVDDLWRIYSRRLYRTIYSITRSPEDAEDALQDAFLRAYLSLDRFEGRSTVYSWLTRIAINSALMVLRKRRARSEVSLGPNGQSGEDTPHFDLKDTAPDPEEIFGQRQRQSCLFHAIQNLEPSLRIPVLMQMMQGCSVKQIGRALGISAPAVKSRLHRARLRLCAASILKYLAISSGNSLSSRWPRRVKTLAVKEN